MARRARHPHATLVQSTSFAGHDWLTRWLSQQIPAFSEPSAKAYQAVWHGYLVALAERGTDAARAGTADVRFFLAGQTKTSTMIRYARLLDRLYLCALEWGWCAHNPLDDIKSTLMQPEPRARPSSLSTTDPSRVLAGLAVPNDMKGRRDVAMLTLAVAAGLRLAEIRTLRLTQLLETPGGLEVQPRAGAARVRNLTLGSAEADRLRAWLKERSTLSVHSPYVFPAKSGEMLPANTLYRRVRRLIEPAHGREGLEHYGLGVLRATYAKQIAQTHSTESTQQHLGHRRLASTRRLLDTLGIKAASIATLEPDSPEEPPSATERTR